jgi:putative riboflavin transport system permease protein
MVDTLERTHAPSPAPVTASAMRPIPESVPPPPRKRRRWGNVFAPIVAVGLLLVVWKLAILIGGYEPFLLPPPETVARAFWDALRDGILWPHMRTTLIEAGYGALLGIAVAVLLGYVIVHVRLLDRALTPIIAASQAMPIVAVAPIIILWFGTGLLPKVLICALIVFFPVLVTWTVGLRAIDPDLIGAANIAGANRWQLLRYVEVPLSLPSLFGGMRIAFTLAVTGAVVGEFVSAKQGLGYLLKQAEFLYDTPLKFVALFCLMAIAAIGYGIIALIERLVLSWEEN